jgi:hypothetical protein
MGPQNSGRQTAYTPHGLPIPGHLVDLAVQQQWQQYSDPVFLDPQNFARRNFAREPENGLEKERVSYTPHGVPISVEAAREAMRRWQQVAGGAQMVPTDSRRVDENRLLLEQAAYTPHGVHIPAHLALQAGPLHQQVAYQPTLGPGEGPQAVGFDRSGAAVFLAGFDGEGWIEGVYGAGIDPRLITVQRYDDHYLQMDVDLISFKRQPISGPTQQWAGSSDPTGGVRVSARLDAFYSFDLDFAYLGGMNWTGQQANIVLRSDTTIGTVALGTFFSNFSAYELNTRWRWVGTSSPLTGAWILGVRYVEFDESLTGILSSINPSPVRLYSQNDLVGFQAGGELFWGITRGVMIGGDLKAGIYGNRVNNSVLLNDVLRPDLSSQGQHAAFLGEANLMVNSALGHGWYIRGGYTGLFMTNLTLMSNLINLDLKPDTKSFGGQLIAHGFYGGLEWQY